MLYQELVEEPFHSLASNGMRPRYAVGTVEESPGSGDNSFASTLLRIDSN